MTRPKPANAWQNSLPHELPLHFRRNIDPGVDGCWLWTRSLSPDGYGWASLSNKTHQAHRLAYTLVVGEVPEGMQLDHLCRVRHCVNPSHLEPVTNRENQIRGQGFPAVNARKSECPRGHAYDAQNTLRDKRGRRSCRECSRLRDRLRDRRKAA